MSESTITRQEVLFDELARQKEALTALGLRLDKLEDELVRLSDMLAVRRPRPTKDAA